jgi:hypothetical protein
MSSLPQKDKKKYLSDSDVQQLDLVKTLDNHKNVKKNRFWVIFLLTITAGLSFIFWSYNYFRQNPISPKFSLNIKLPIFTTNYNQANPDLKSVIDPYLQPNPDAWSIYVETLPGSVHQFSWSYLPDSIFNQTSSSQLISQIQTQPISSDSTIRNNLPQGTEIKQIKNISDISRQYQILVGLPRWQIFMVIQVSSPANLDESSQKIPSLIKDIYWSIVSQY